MTSLHFRKYHGLGNDYLVCHRDVVEQLSNEHIQMLRHRHYGMGSDGLLIDSGDQISPTLCIVSPDGPEAEKGGSGLRIYACCLFGIGRIDHEPFLVHTAGGGVYYIVHGDVHQVDIDMGRANFNPAALPTLVNLPGAVNYPLPLTGETLSVVLASMDNPHCVVLVDKLDLAQVHRLGPQIRNHSPFPRRTNVQFVEVIDRRTLEIGIWERGAGFTVASRSSGYTAASAMRRLGRVGDRVDVNMLGGQLHITFDADFQVRMHDPMHRITSLTLDRSCFVGDNTIFTGTA